MPTADQHAAGALAIRPDQASFDTAQLAALRQLGVEEAPAGDLAVFLHYAQRTGLDPFARQLYMIPRKSRGQTRWTIMAGIDALRIVAQRSGEYAGQTAPQWCGADGVWREVWLENGHPAAARIGVYRRGFAEPLVAVARWASYAPYYDGKPTGLWGQMPDVMLAKVAEALALRKAFPQDLSGVYTAEEMDQAEASSAPPAASPQETAAAERTAASAEQRNAQLPLEQVAELRRQVLAAGNDEELLGAWQAAKAAGALELAVAVPEAWQETARGQVEADLHNLVAIARQALRDGIPHGEELPEPEVVEGELVEEEPPAEPALCQAQREDGQLCDKPRGHDGRHRYARTPEPCPVVTDGFPCTLQAGHDGGHVA